MRSVLTLILLCHAWQEITRTNKILIDYGRGSGILAIAAAKSGARQVIAVDNDPQVLQATRVNAEANSVGPLEVEATESVIQVKADILVANILLEPLMTLVGVFRGLLCPAGELLMSGVLEDQSAQLRVICDPYFNFDTCEQQAEWVGCMLSLNSHGFYANTLSNL